MTGEVFGVAKGCFMPDIDKRVRINY